MLLSHITGDVLLQTEWQAQNKPSGLGDDVARRALGRHIVSYTATFTPALGWIAKHRGAGRAIAVGGLVSIPHLIIDDGRLVRFWMREVKHVPEPAPGLVTAVDQSFHVLCLLGAALVAAR